MYSSHILYGVMGMRWRLRRFFRRIVVLILAVLVLCLVLRGRYRDVIRDLAQTQVKKYHLGSV